MAMISLETLATREEIFRTDNQIGYESLVNAEGVQLGEGKQTRSKTQWGDGIFYQKYVEPLERNKQLTPSIERLKDCYLAFLNYYTYGILPPRISGIDLVNSVIYYLVGDAGLVFDLFMIREVEQEKLYGAKVLKDHEPKWVSLATSDDREAQNYDFPDANAFYKESSAALMSNAERNDTESTMQMLGHLALKTLKLLCKDFVTFEKNCFNASMGQLSGIMNYQGKKIPPPHANLQNLKDVSNMTNETTVENLTLATMIYCNLGKDYGETMKAYVSSACFKTLEDVGLASLKFAKQASESLRMPLSDLLDQMWFEELESEVKTLLNGILSTKNCSTWMVARIYDDKCLVEFSAYNIPKLTLTFALAAHEEKDWLEVVKWPSLKCTSAFYELAKDLAKALKETQSMATSMVPVSDKAKAIQKKIAENKKKNEEKITKLKGTLSQKETGSGDATEPVASTSSTSTSASAFFSKP